MNTIDQIFEILKAEPLVTIIMGFLLAGFLAWILRAQIVLYIKQKYNLYDESELQVAVDEKIDELQSMAKCEKIYD